MSALFYTTPSHGDWNRALPIGNGKLGAMIFGEGTGEHFQLNEDSVWFGQKRNRNNPDALANLDTIRRYIFGGKIEKAEELCKYALAGTPQSQHTYQTLGDVYFDYCGKLKEGIDFERNWIFPKPSTQVGFCRKKPVPYTPVKPLQVHQGIVLLRIFAVRRQANWISPPPCSANVFMRLLHIPMIPF